MQLVVDEQIRRTSVFYVCAVGGTKLERKSHEQIVSFYTYYFSCLATIAAAALNISVTLNTYEIICSGIFHFSFRVSFGSL